MQNSDATADLAHPSTAHRRPPPWPTQKPEHPRDAREQLRNWQRSPPKCRMQKAVDERDGLSHPSKLHERARIDADAAVSATELPGGGGGAAEERARRGVATPAAASACLVCCARCSRHSDSPISAVRRQPSTVHISSAPTWFSQ